MENNMIIEGHAVRILQKKMTDKTTLVHSRNDHINHVAPKNDMADEFYTE